MSEVGYVRIPDEVRRSPELTLRMAYADMDERGGSVRTLLLKDALVTLHRDGALYWRAANTRQTRRHKAVRNLDQLEFSRADFIEALEADRAAMLEALDAITEAK